MVRDPAIVLQRMVKDAVDCADINTHNGGFVEVSEVEPQVSGQLRRQDQRMYSRCEWAGRSCQRGEFLYNYVRALLAGRQVFIP